LKEEAARSALKKAQNEEELAESIAEKEAA